MDQTYFKDKWLDDDSPYAIWVARHKNANGEVINTNDYNVLQNTL